MENIVITLHHFHLVVPPSKASLKNGFTWTKVLLVLVSARMYFDSVRRTTTIHAPAEIIILHNHVITSWHHTANSVVLLSIYSQHHLLCQSSGILMQGRDTSTRYYSRRWRQELLKSTFVQDLWPSNIIDYICSTPSPIDEINNIVGQIVDRV